MVSTRLMSTSSNAGNNGSTDESVRMSVVTRQSSANCMSVNSSTISTVPTQRQSTAAATSTRQSHLTQAVKATPAGSGINCCSAAAVAAIQLLDLPVEILSKIFAYVGYKKIGQLRVVSQKMNDICMHVLNSTFAKLITHTLNRFHAIKANMPRRESARRNHPLACECDIIETCYMRLSLLQMTFGKHIERGHCCFFPGAILDEVYTILYYIKNTPRLERPYKVTDELFDLSTMAMEYFRDRIEPTRPDIAYFNKDFFKLHTNKRPALVIASDLSDNSSSLPSPPQSNMVLRKGIRKIKQGMKMYNNQLSVLRNELRTCKRKSSEQGKQIAEQQKLLSEQQKQTLEYANRLDENDKKNEEMSRKFSTLLQELNKCKTELQYWRSKSPAIPTCTSCGQKVTPALPPEDYQALINQGIKPEDIILNINDDTDAESDAGTSEHNLSLGGEFVFPDETTTAKLLAVNTAAKNLKRQHSSMVPSSSSNTSQASSAAIMAEDEMPTTSKRMQHQKNHHNQQQQQHTSGKPTEMTNSLNHNRNQNIVKTICTSMSLSAATPTSKDLINNTAMATAAFTIGSNTGVESGEVGKAGSAGCSPSVFYGSNAHKGVIVSPLMSAKSGANERQANAASGNAAHDGVGSAIDGSEEHASSSNGNSSTTLNESSKKARRVQKATRFSTSGGKRGK